jgi:hypothetical protein
MPDTLNLPYNTIVGLTVSTIEFPFINIENKEKPDVNINRDVSSSLYYPWEESFKEDLISNLVVEYDTPNLATLLIELEEDLGSDLFRQLSYNDKVFLIKTSGSLDFGRIIDLNQVAKNIEDYGH